MKYFAVSGFSNTGKTSLIVDIVEKLTEQGKTVTIIKHSEHSILSSKKDTDLFLLTKADRVVFWGRDGAIYYNKNRLQLENLLAEYSDYDFLIIEGAKHIDEIPKIWIGPLDEDVKNIKAYITKKGEEKKWNIPTFKREDITSLLSFLLSL